MLTLPPPLTQKTGLYKAKFDYLSLPCLTHTKKILTTSFETSVNLYH